MTFGDIASTGIIALADLKHDLIRVVLPSLLARAEPSDRYPRQRIGDH